MTTGTDKIIIEDANFELAFIQKRGNWITRVVLDERQVIYHQNGDISIRFKFPEPKT